MTRHCDSSVADPDSSDLSDVETEEEWKSSSSADEKSDESDILMLKGREPTIVGANITVCLWAFYLFTISVGCAHFILVMQATTALKGSYLITVMFGLLGPISAFYWFLTGVFAVHGFRALYMRARDFYLAASYFRRWVRVSRYLRVTALTCSVQFVYGCMMFVKGTSMSESASRIMDQERIPKESRQRKATAIAASLYDSLVLSNAGVAMAYPLNFLHFTGKQIGVMIPFGIVLPIAFLSGGLRALEIYYNWRYLKSGISID